MFGGKVSEEHRVHVTDWWSEVMGGPGVYTDQRGGYAHMLAMHHNLGITGDQRLTFVTLLSRAADDVGLPGDPEFRAALMGYAEWGTRLAVHNSQPDAQVVEQAPVPRWGWGVLAPYTPPSDPPNDPCVDLRGESPGTGPRERGERLGAAQLGIAGQSFGRLQAPGELVAEARVPRRRQREVIPAAGCWVSTVDFPRCRAAT